MSVIIPGQLLLDGLSEFKNEIQVDSGEWIRDQDTEDGLSNIVSLE
jgi:hypothetical protein